MLMIISLKNLDAWKNKDTAAAIEKSGTADTMVGQKSGPALA